MPNDLYVFPTNHTHNVTMTPTVEHTLGPSIEPTYNPTALPSVDPTSAPTRMPSNTPTTTPTIVPTMYPTMQPTKINWMVDSIWSPYYTQIFINIRNNDINLSHGTLKPLSINCEQIFHHNTTAKLGTSICVWNNDVSTNSEIYGHDITIFLVESTLFINDSLVISSQAFELCYTESSQCVGNKQIITSIVLPSDPITPIIQDNVPLLIGVCDDLILDARDTIYLGGRPAIFEWNINNDTHYGNYIILKDISIGNHYIVLTVTSWYGAKASKSYNVTKLSNVVPGIDLQVINGINLQHSNTLRIISEITWINSCISTTNFIDYHLEWDVFGEIISTESYPINTTMWKQLQDYIKDSFINQYYIEIDIQQYMQPNIKYTFQQTIICQNSFDCHKSESIELPYISSPIFCGIKGGNIEIANISYSSLSNYKLNLDGYFLTYDGDNIESKDHLIFEWSCFKILSNQSNISCTGLIDDASSSITFSNIGNDKHNRSEKYVNKYILDVSDNRYPSRQKCETFIMFQVNSIMDADLSIKDISVTITPIKSTISPNEKLRIITTFNDDNLNTENYNFEWSEKNNIITVEKLNECMLNKESSKNLIIEANCLEKGYMYEIELKIFEYDYDNNVVGFGVASTNIEVKLDVLVSQEMSIWPKCDETFDNVMDLWNTKYSFSLNIDTVIQNNDVLLYEFEVKNIVISNKLFNAYVDGISLPIGVHNVYGTVYDNGVLITRASAECDIKITNKELCLDDINIDYVALDNHFFQLLQVMISYYQVTSNVTCKELILDQLIISLDKIVHSQENIFCQSYQVINLGYLLMNMLEYNLKVNQDLFSNLVQHILDPCVILRNISTDDLSLNEVSIITNVPIIYYNEDPITTFSIIITDLSYNDAFYMLTELLITEIVLIDNETIVEDISSLVQKSLFVNELVKLSTSIPGEESSVVLNNIQIYSARTDDDINVGLNNINISIDSSNTEEGLFDTKDFESTDVLIIGINNTKTDDTAFINPCNNNAIKGQLYEDSVSITLIGSVNTSNLSSNVNMTFTDAAYENSLCVWLDEVNNIWRSDGCKTILDDEGNIICSCSHLTQFSIIYDLKIGSKQWNDCNQLKTNNDDKMYDIINIVFGCIFSIIFLYITILIFPFCIYKDLNLKHKGVISMLILDLIVLLYACICIGIWLLSITDESWYNIISEMVAIVVLIPLAFYFALFSMIFYTWYSLAKSIDANALKMKRKLRRVLYSLNIFITTLLIGIYILFAIDFGDHYTKIILKYSQIVYTIFIGVILISFMIYGIKMSMTLYRTTMHIKGQSFGLKEWQLTKKLIIINQIITVYFIYQLCQSIYLIFISNNHINLWLFRTLDLLSNLICIISILYLYQNPIIKLKAKSGHSFKLFSKSSIKWNTLKSLSLTSTSTSAQVTSSVKYKKRPSIIASTTKTSTSTLNINTSTLNINTSTTLELTNTPNNLDKRISVTPYENK